MQILLLAPETGLLRLGSVSIDGTKIDANASKIRSVRYDRACELRIKLVADIAHLTAQAEAADAQGHDPREGSGYEGVAMPSHNPENARHSGAGRPLS